MQSLPTLTSAINISGQDLVKLKAIAFPSVTIDFFFFFLSWHEVIEATAWKTGP